MCISEKNVMEKKLWHHLFSMGVKPSHIKVHPSDPSAHPVSSCFRRCNTTPFARCVAWRSSGSAGPAPSSERAELAAPGREFAIGYLPKRTTRFVKQLWLRPSLCRTSLPLAITRRVRLKLSSVWPLLKAVPSIKSQPAKGTQIKLSDQNYGQRLVYKMKSYS